MGEAYGIGGMVRGLPAHGACHGTGGAVAGEDPALHAAMDRLRARGMDVGKRLQAGVLQWYRQGITQTGIDARLKARRSRLAALGLANGPDAGPIGSQPARPAW